MTRRYLVNGWVVSAPFDLGHPAPADAPIDVTVELHPDALEPAAAHQPLEGRVVAHLGEDDRYHELVVHDRDRATLRFGGLADFAIDRAARRTTTGPTVVTAHVVADADETLIPLLVAGTVLSALLMLEGHMVLHASAVEIEGRTVAFVGTSGSGKSTLATMACLAGGRLVSDDVLRVGVVDERAVCYRGAAHLRLRPGAVGLLAGTDHPETRTADGRRVFAPDTPGHSMVPLDAVVLPLLCPPDAAITRTRLGTKQALFALLGSPRVSNWTDPDTSARHLATLLDLVERIPVYAVEIPWGVGPGSTTIEQVMAAVWAAEAPPDDASSSHPHR